jgi:hypothetical protein
LGKRTAHTTAVSMSRASIMKGPGIEGPRAGFPGTETARMEVRR